MASFLDVFGIPNVGYNISDYFTFEECLKFDCVCKDVREINRDTVYPMYKTICLDTVVESLQDHVGVGSYLNKMSPYVHTVVASKNSTGVCIPRINKLPKLREVTYAVPLILDVTLQIIHADTHRLWQGVNNFLQSLTSVDNKVEMVNIVPGTITLLRTDVDTNETLDIRVLHDMSAGTHLRMYRRYQMPVTLMTRLPKIKIFTAPSQLMSLPTKNMAQEISQYINWDTTEGPGSFFMDLIV
jgi:hypothetical protein